MFRKLQEFMYGRYGSDALNRFLSIVALVFYFLSFFIRKSIFVYVAMGLLLLTLVRMLSKNIGRRQAENYKFMVAKQKVQGFFTGKKREREAKRYHCHFKCPTCKQKVRVPKGVGKISITCPKCGNKFQKQT